MIFGDKNQMNETDMILHLMEACRLCPCDVNRLEGKKGFCGVDAKMMVARVFFICGRNPAFPGKKDRELCFFQAVRWDAISARTDAYQEDSVGSRLRSNTLWIFF